MAPYALKIDARRRKILEILEREGRVSAARLSEDLGATVVTIRSDLNALARDGFLERIQGGAIRKMRVQPQQAASACAEEKKAIARTAARQIPDGSTLFINSGTTTLQLALALKDRRNLQVVTNSVPVAAELNSIAGFRVILLGGTLDPQYLYTSGGDAQEQLQKYQADYALLSLDGVSPAAGITTHHADEAIIDRLMVERAARTWILADHTKMGRAGFSLICPLEQVHTVITDPACGEAAVRAIRDARVRVLLAGEEASP